MREIALTNGRGVALVDDADFDALALRRWLWSNGYAYTYLGRAETRPYGHRGGLMHRIVACAPTGMDVDHIDGDRLNNQRANLRVCTRSENMRNRNASRTTARSGVLGVHADGARWSARLHVNGRTMDFGTFDTIAEARAARIAGEREVFGEFAPIRSDA